LWPHGQSVRQTLPWPCCARDPAIAELGARPGAAAFTTVSGCVAATIRQNGFRGPFQGLGATLVRNTPANAIYLGSFELIKRQAAERYHCPCGPAPAAPRLQPRACDPAPAAPWSAVDRIYAR